MQRAIALQGKGRYVVQAAIAHLHMQEPRDRPGIESLYAALRAGIELPDVLGRQFCVELPPVTLC